MDDFGDGPSLPAFPLQPRGDGNNGDRKKANSGASAATSKTPEVGNGEDCNKSQSGVGQYSVAFEAQPTRGNEATPERDVVAVQDGETEIGFGNDGDGDGDEAESQDLEVVRRTAIGPEQEGAEAGRQESTTIGPEQEGAEAGRQESRLPEPHALQQRSEQSLVAKPHVQAQSSEVVARSQQLSSEEQLGEILSTKFKSAVEGLMTQLVEVNAKDRLETKEENAEHHRKMEEMNAKHRLETKEEYAELHRNLEKERDAYKRGIERLQVTVTQLSKELDSVREDMKKLRQRLRAEKHGKKELRKQARKKGNEVKHMKERLDELFRVELQESDQLRDVLAKLYEKYDDILAENERLWNELAAAKPHVPENPDTYPLDDFTGYAIVVASVVFYKDDYTKAALKDSERLAQALFDYGFRVTTMRNPTAKEVLEHIRQCDDQQPQPGLVFIYIDAHGESPCIWLTGSDDGGITRNQIAVELPKRKRDDKPTILCVTSCRSHGEESSFKEEEEEEEEETKAKDVDVPVPGVSSIFFVDACQPGYKARAEHFVDGLVGILNNPLERDFHRAIADLKKTKDCKGLHYHDQLTKSLVLPRVPAMKRTPREKADAKKNLEQFFKYEPQTTTATTP